MWVFVVDIMLLIGHALQLRFGEGKVALEMTIHMIRVNVSARAGDDLFIGQEVVTFLVLDGTSLARLWTGLNGKLDRRCDSSFLLTDAVDMLPDGRGANLLRMRFGQGKMALKRTIHIPAAPSSAAYPETAFILPTRAHTLPLGVCFARTTSTSPRSSP